MLPYRDSRLTKLAIGIFFVIVLGYAYFEARGILYGPRIHVSSATTEVSDPFITVKGQADRISSLSMNGKPITVTEDGAFSEPYLLAPGLNRIALDARDKYGRESREIIEIVYTPHPADSSVAPPPDQGLAATSTPAAASSTPSVAQ
jgi:hypothetical protein